MIKINTGKYVDKRRLSHSGRENTMTKSDEDLQYYRNEKTLSITRTE